MNKLDDNENCLYKITIATDKTDEIVKQLNSYGITYASLFPDISNIAQQIKEEGIFKI